MKILFPIFLISVTSLSSSAQSHQQQKVDSVFTLVAKYFNAQNADAIYNLAGNDFQQELSINQFNDVTTKQLFPYGPIKESSLISFVNDDIATYKLKFASGLMQLQLSLDAKNKLRLFLFQSYNEQAGNKTALVQTSNPLRSDLDKKVDTVARKYIQKANTVGMCIGIIKDGKTTVYNYGETVKHNGKLPNADTFFEIGSITKTFTATLLAYYVNEGVLKLSDPLVMYLPDSVAVNQALTGIKIVDLINHTSGLASVPENLQAHISDQLDPYKDYTRDMMLSYLKTCKLISRPGEKYVYSNFAVGLLGVILESINRKPFEQMVNEVICKPLGMLSTAQYLNPLMSPRFVTVYNENGQPTAPWNFNALAACGALRSTVSDLLLYAVANMHPSNTQLSKAMQLAQTVTFNKGDVKMGLAWHTIIINGIPYQFHNGGTYGSSSFLAFNAEKNLAVIILSNAAESTDATGIGMLKKLQ